MLKNKPKYKVVLIGSTSEIGLAIVQRLSRDYEVDLTVIGRNCPDDFIQNNSQIATQFVYSDFLSEDLMLTYKNYFDKVVALDLVIVAIGYLPRENGEFVFSEVKNSVEINTLIPILTMSQFGEFLLNNDGGKMLYISSLATVRPRSRNFTYGATKKASDYFTLGLIRKYKNSKLEVYLVRTGYVYSKMSSSFEPSMFASTPIKLAEGVVRGIQNNSKIMYYPRKLRVLSYILLLIPQKIFDRL